MSPRVDHTKQCDVMGCRLPYMHSGMHQIMVCKRKRNSDPSEYINNAQYHNNTNLAHISTSPSYSRNDELVPTRDTELEMIKTRLLFLQKSINDLINTFAED